jgi:hypothetical protein
MRLWPKQESSISVALGHTSAVVSKMCMHCYELNKSPAQNLT